MWPIIKDIFTYKQSDIKCNIRLIFLTYLVLFMSRTHIRPLQTGIKLANTRDYINLKDTAIN